MPVTPCTFDEHDLCQRHGVPHPGPLRCFALGTDARSEKYRRYWDTLYTKKTLLCPSLGPALRDAEGKAITVECHEG